MHAKMNDKRLRKLDPLKQRAISSSSRAIADARLGVISLGQHRRRRAGSRPHRPRRGIKVKLLIPKLIYPIAEEVYRLFFASLHRGLVVEQSHQGQLHRIIRMWVDVPARPSPRSPEAAPIPSPRTRRPPCGSTNSPPPRRRAA
jgi:2-oxoglutarate ferredoxin oxidoreductase subunit alpha